MPDAPSAPDAHMSARLLLPLSTRDRIAIAVLLLFPLVMFGAPAVFGHLFAPGDDLNQNLPLRVLSGEFIRAGQVPAWNPLIWTGTPLLGGWNAGSFFPGTFLFAFLPLSLAWTLNLAAAPALAGLGLYLLLRRFGTAELGATFGALIFSYTGFMAGQMVHIGLVQGTAFTPWIILGLDVFFRTITTGPDATGPDATGPDATGPNTAELATFKARITTQSRMLFDRRMQLWIVILAISIACTVLAGDPRAISTGAIAALIYLVVMLARKGSQRVAGLLLMIVATVIGAMVSAAQLLPGMSFLSASQRGTTALSFFTTGSVSGREIIAHLLVPFALGGNGNFGLPFYEGGYNLPELTFGSGLIALVAFAAFIPETVTGFVSRLRRVRDQSQRDPRCQLGVWFGFLIIGGLLTFGANWRVGRLLVHIPFFGNERLQNRNALLMDLALAVFAGLFLDEMFRAIREQRFATHRLRRGVTKYVALIPIVLALVMILFELIDPVKFQRFFSTFSIDRSFNLHLLGYLLATLVVAGAIGIFWLFGNRLKTGHARIALCALVFCDVGLYVANASYATAPASLFNSETTLSTQVKHLLGAQGRFALYDPFFAITSPNPGVVDAVGLPDINALQGNPSVQGYGSLVNGVYQRVTGSHVLNNLNPKILAGESANTLDLRVLLTPPNYLENRLGNKTPIPMPSALDNLAPGVPHMTTGPWIDDAGDSTTWQLPTPQNLRIGTFLINSSTLSNGRVNVELLNGVRVVDRTSFVPSSSTVRVRFNPSVAATTLLVTNTSGTAINIVAVAITTSKPNERFVLNGMLQGYMPMSHWTYDGNVGPLSAFKNIQIHGLAWLQPTTTHTPNTHAATTGTVTVTRGAITAEQVMRVRTPTAAILVRSEAYSAGWSVTVKPAAGGTVVHQVVRRFGLIQEVTLPPGNWVVSWRYRPKTLTEGLILSVVGLIALVVLIAVVVYRYRRRGVASAGPAKELTIDPEPFDPEPTDPVVLDDDLVS